MSGQVKLGILGQVISGYVSLSPVIPGYIILGHVSSGNFTFVKFKSG